MTKEEELYEKIANNDELFSAACQKGRAIIKGQRFLKKYGYPTMFRQISQYYAGFLEDFKINADKYAEKVNGYKVSCAMNSRITQKASIKSGYKRLPTGTILIPDSIAYIKDDSNTYVSVSLWSAKIHGEVYKKYTTNAQVSFRYQVHKNGTHVSAYMLSPQDKSLSMYYYHDKKELIICYYPDNSLKHDKSVRQCNNIKEAFDIMQETVDNINVKYFTRNFDIIKTKYGAFKKLPFIFVERSKEIYGTLPLTNKKLQETVTMLNNLRDDMFHFFYPGYHDNDFL